MLMEKKTTAVPKGLQKYVCVHCLQKSSKINHIKIEPLGMGSLFYGEGTIVQLCDQCYQKSRSLWSMKRIQSDGVIRYRMEKQMEHYLDTLPLPGRELVHNTFNFGPLARHYPSQDWIDYQLDRLPAERCKKLNLLTPEEITSLRKQFSSNIPCEISDTKGRKEKRSHPMMQTA